MHAHASGVERRARRRCLPGRRALSVALVAVASIALATSPAEALTLAPMSLVELTALAPIVVRARCSERQSAAVGDGRIDSVARFDVVEHVKGAAPDRIDVRQLGGRAGGVEVVVPGAPLSEAGDEALLFLTPGDSGMLEVVGIAHGYLPIAAVPGGEAVIRVAGHLVPDFAGRPIQPLARVVERVRVLAGLRR